MRAFVPYPLATELKSSVRAPGYPVTHCHINNEAPLVRPSRAAGDLMTGQRIHS